MRILGALVKTALVVVFFPFALIIFIAVGAKK